jgi:hypothetical protein
MAAGFPADDAQLSFPTPPHPAGPDGESTPPIGQDHPDDLKSFGQSAPYPFYDVCSHAGKYSYSKKKIKFS